MNEYKKKIQKEKITIKVIQFLLVISFFSLWEILSNTNIINSFIFSSPSRIMKTIMSLILDHKILNHLLATTNEVIISFSISIIISFTTALIYYIIPIIKKILDPFITLLNSMPKVALGPLLIIWLGANTKTIIVMSLLISLIVTTTTIYTGFNKTDKNMIKLFKIYHASYKDYITKLIIPYSKDNIIEALKLNSAMTLIGVIMGEFLCSKEGIGYLILYGTQIFNLSLVMSGILILLVLSGLFYLLIVYIEYLFKQKNHIK